MQATCPQQPLDLLAGPGLAAEPDEGVGGDQLGVGLLDGVAGGDHHQRFAGNLVQHQPLGGDLGAGGNGDIQLGSAHHLGQFRRQPCADPDGELRVPRPEPRQRRGQQMHHLGRNHADGEGTGQRLIRAQRPDFVFQRCHAPGLLDQGGAARGEARRALAAVDKRNA